MNLANPHRRHVPGAWALVLAPIVVFMAVVRWSGDLLIGCIGVGLSALAAWWFAGGPNGGVAGLGLERPSSWWRTAMAGVVIAVCAAGALALVGGLITRTLGAPNLEHFASMRQHPVELAEWLAITWTTAAFGEEIIFRGFLLPQLSPVDRLGRWGWAVGILASSSLFGLAHSYQGAGGAVASGIVGAVFATAFVLGRGNLYRTIIAHGLFDSVSMIILFMTLRGRL